MGKGSLRRITVPRLGAAMLAPSPASPRNSQYNPHGFPLKKHASNNTE